MNDRILDYTNFCVNGTKLLDGQVITELGSYVSYGVIINEDVDIPKLNAALKELYSEIDIFHMHLAQDEEGIYYCFDERISEDIHILHPGGNTPEERLEAVKTHVI
jgi:hypothetical protein